MQVKNYDLVIIGGGLVGSSLLLALKKSGLKIALVEPKQLEDRVEPKLDQRSLVLSLGSKLYYEQLNIWPLIEKETTKINTIKISEQGCFNKLFLDKKSFGVDALGYVVNIQKLNNSLWQRINTQDNIDVLCPCKLKKINDDGKSLDLEYFHEDKLIQMTISANIIVAADGVKSYVRELLGIPTDIYDYKQIALIANVEHELTNNNIAYERFSSQGPFALLPRENKNISGIVWPWPEEDIDYVKNLSDHDILSKLQKLFGYKLGRFINIGKRQFFPLWRISTKQLFKERVIFLGNSANNIHPIGGQGFNLGLRDVKFFSDLLFSHKQMLVESDFSLEVINSLFNEYQNKRCVDHENLLNNTHNVLNLFNNSSTLVKLVRNFGLTAVNHSLILRTMIADNCMGLRV